MTPPELTLSGRWVEPPPITLRPTIRLAHCTGMRRSVRSTKTINATTAIMSATSRSTAGTVKAPQASVCTLSYEVGDAARQADHDAGEDQQRHAVADAALGDLLAQPHDEHRTGGQREHRHEHEADAGVGNEGGAGGGLALQGDGDAEGLQGAENQRQVARPLR